MLYIGFIFLFEHIFRWWYKNNDIFLMALLHSVIGLSNKLWAEYAEFKDELIVEEDPRKHVRRFAFFEKE